MVTVIDLIITFDVLTLALSSSIRLIKASGRPGATPTMRQQEFVAFVTRATRAREIMG